MHQVLDPPLGDTHLFDDLIGFVHQPLFFLSRVHHKMFGCLMWLSKELQMIEQWVFFVAEVHARSLLMLLLWLRKCAAEEGQVVHDCGWCRMRGASSY